MIGPLFNLLVGQQMTRGRAALVAAMTVAMTLIGLAMNAGIDSDERVEVVLGFLSVVGLGLITPILCLIFASSSLGQLVEDNTLVYLWLRPYPRWQLAAAAFLASTTVALPATLLPTAMTALVGTGGNLSATWAVIVPTALGAIGYCALFVFFGILMRRSLEFGLIYIFIWELFVARAGSGAARLSLNTYPASLLARLSGFDYPQADRSTMAAILVPLLAVPIGIWLTTWRLNRADVA